jgi:uncharacterized protein
VSFDPTTLAIVCAVFALAGFVKGVVGLGLPTVTLALLTIMVDLPSAMALMLVPSFVTNLWQGSVGGHGKQLLRRLALFLLLATACVWLGALALVRIDVQWLAALLGVLLVVYAVVGLAGLKVSVKPTLEQPVGAVLGIINGVLTGMTGSFVVPGVMYLQALGLPRDALVQAMGILFTLSTLALAIALGGARLLSEELGLVSVAGLVPAIAGMVVGQRIRRRLSETGFRRVFLLALLAVGSYIVLRSLSR